MHELCYYGLFHISKKRAAFFLAVKNKIKNTVRTLMNNSQGYHFWRIFNTLEAEKSLLDHAAYWRVISLHIYNEIF